MNNTPTLPASRQAALAALEQTLPLSGKAGQDIQAALDNTLGKVSDPRDRALATELTYGFARHRLRLERLVATHLSRPDRTPPLVVRVCALAAYELAFLDSVPAHATLSWAVDAVKARLDQTRANLANAVLRCIQALGPDISNREFYDSTCRDETEALCVWHSCPRWLVELWLRDYGREAALGLLDAQMRPPLAGVRVNRLKPGWEPLLEDLASSPGLAARRGPWLGFHPGKGPSPSELARLEAEGLASRQSVAAGDILLGLDATTWAGPVWDACAGRGGKTDALLEMGHARVLSSDPSLKRLRGLSAEAARLGLPAPLAFRADATCAPLRPGGLGTVLVDAPCSGLGVLSRRPDAKWKRAPADVEALAGLQRRILEACAPLVRPGGLLVYMTCTLTRAENDGHAAFIEGLGFSPMALCEPRAASGLREFFWGGVWERR